MLEPSEGGRLHEDGHVEAVELRRHLPPRGDARPEHSRKTPIFTKTLARLTTRWFGYTRVRKKRFLNFLQDDKISE